VTETVQWNPFASGAREDPYPQYTALRRQGAVAQTEFGMWTLWRHGQVSQLLRSRLSVDETLVDPPTLGRQLLEQALGGPRAEPLKGTLLELDPPDHTRLRKLVSRAFTPRAIEALEPDVTRLVDEALDRIADAGTVDLVEALAFPLPFTVISTMLGMPDVDAAELRRISGLLVRALEPVGDLDLLRAIAAAEGDMTALMTDVVAWKRHHPADDMFTALIEAEADGDHLSEEELVRQVTLIYLAGHETTVNLISGGTLALLRHPGELQRLRDDPRLDGNAVEELLRYDSPVQLTRRVTLEDMDIDGVTIPARSFVLGVLASANRDEDVFGPDADRLRLDRPNAAAHVSFSAGVHHCLGAALARLEGRVAVPRLVRRFPDLALAGEVDWNGRLNLRGPAALPVAVR
jgi:cytochrome P450